MNAPEPDWIDRTEQALLDAALPLAPRYGWTTALVQSAGQDIGLSAGDLELLVPHGPQDLAALLSRRHDTRALWALTSLDSAALKIRERIARGVSARLEAAAEDLEASKRCAGFLALPMNVALGARLTWEAADLVWRWAGDTATDWNHYSKRVILSGMLAPAMTLRLFDGREAAEAFVANRIENVMAFEKWKAGKDFDAPMNGVIKALSRMRYGKAA